MVERLMNLHPQVVRIVSIGFFEEGQLSASLGEKHCLAPLADPFHC